MQRRPARGLPPRARLDTTWLLSGRKIVPVDLDRSVFPEGNLQDFVDRLGIAQAIEGQNEQPLLDIEGHQPGRHVQTDQTCMHLLEAEQRREVYAIAGDEDVSVVDGTAHDRPIPA